MVTTYNALIAYAPTHAGLGNYDMHCVSNDNFSFLILCQPDIIFFVALCKLSEDKQCRWPDRAQYTQEDIDALAFKLADYPVPESLSYGELWRNRTRAHLVSLEEGVPDHWFFGRGPRQHDPPHPGPPPEQKTLQRRDAARAPNPPGLPPCYQVGFVSWRSQLTLSLHW